MACLLLGLSGSLAVQAANQKLPPGLNLPKGFKLPADVTLAVYLPPAERKSRFFLKSAGIWIQPGKALESGIDGVAQQYFARVIPVELAANTTYGLLLDIKPKWKVEEGMVNMTMTYHVFGAENKLLLDDTKSVATKLGSLGNGASLYKAAMLAAQEVMIDVMNKLRPDAAQFPDTLVMSAVQPDLLIDHDKPYATGTGFYVNQSGQVLTAAHVLDDCTVVEMGKDEKMLPVRIVAQSALLDLAVVDTGAAVEKFLPLRQGSELLLGEPVTNVGYPLQGVLASSPNLTRGNVSSNAGLQGSLGLFQFSAPIQPGSSGGPVVADGGELLGITVSSLNSASLVESGVLPQNVNFALNARYANLFMKHNNIAFSEVPTNLKGDIRIANEAALSTVVKVACYQ